eukprot:EG_transcript_4555
MGTACTKSDAVAPYPRQVTHVECGGKWSDAARRASPYSNCSHGLSVNVSVTAESLAPPPPPCFAPRRCGGGTVDPASQCMLDLLPYPALLLEADQGRVLGLNERALLLFGCATAVELDAVLRAKYDAEVRTVQRCGAAFRAGRSHPRTLFVPAVNSQVIHNPFYLPDDRQAVLCSFFPNSEKVSIDQEVERPTQAERAATPPTLDAIRQLNHDLRTPLSICIGVAEILQESAGDREAETHLETLLENLNCLQERINQLLTEQGQPSGCCLVETFCLEEVVHDVVSHLQPRARPGMHVQVQAPGPWPQVVGHLSNVHAVLRRLIRIGMTNERANRLIIITQWKTERQFQVRMALEGLSSTDLRQLTCSPTFTACRQGAQAIGGDLLAADSVDSCGKWEPEVLFTGHVQDRLCSPSKRLGSTTPSSSATTNCTEWRVLIVDDLPINRHIMAAKCQRLGFHDITHAVDGRDAVNHLSREKFDLVLMDVQMPILDGVQATELVRHATDPGLVQNKDVPILAVTAHNFPQERDRCLAAGFTCFCPKPLADDVLRGAVAEICSAPRSAGRR